MNGISTIIAASSRDVGTDSSRIYIWSNKSQRLGDTDMVKDDALTWSSYKNWVIIGLLIVLFLLNSMVRQLLCNVGDLLIRCSDFTVFAGLHLGVNWWFL